MPIAILVVSLLSCRALNELQKAHDSKQDKAMPHLSKIYIKKIRKSGVFPKKLYLKEIFFAEKMWYFSLGHEPSLF